jgi:hypothetical protein
VPKPPPHLKVNRAKVIVDDAGVKHLTVCESRGEEKYIAESETVLLAAARRWIDSDRIWRPEVVAPQVLLGFFIAFESHR